MPRRPGRWGTKPCEGSGGRWRSCPAPGGGERGGACSKATCSETCSAWTRWKAACWRRG
ncbi:hypothetical protein T484DRAFT_1924249 [Baffinella frigidus]|nr:hypothetical protein T484DRAFT_1924249 [Cryptophyta sp. CCMP2293]